MRHGRLQRLIEAYGADPARWPAEERDAAVRRAAGDPAAQAALAEARQLDDLLDRLEAPEAGALSLPAALPAQQRPFLAGLASWRLWPGVAVLAMASVLGVAIGLSDIADRVAGASNGDVAALVFEAPATEDWTL